MHHCKLQLLLHSTAQCTAASSLLLSYLDHLAPRCHIADACHTRCCCCCRRAGRVWFINRLPVFASERGVRKFTAREAASGVLLGFIFFDGVYEASKLVGYYANVTRMRPDAHPGVLNLLVSNFMDRWGVQCAAHVRQVCLLRRSCCAAVGAAW
jgi:hypothetical protein